VFSISEWTGEEEPEGVEGDGEKVVEEEEGFWGEAARG
jgi:hypothetical protein